MGVSTAWSSGITTRESSAISAAQSASVVLSRGYAKGWCRTSTRPYRHWIDSCKDRVSRPVIVPVPWQRLGVLQ
jgi:hypothetical protein